MKILIIFTVGIFFNALANILIKASSLKDKEAITTPDIGTTSIILAVLNPVFIGGLASFGLALLAYRYVLGQGLKLSLAYPVFTSVGFIIVLVASSFIFREKLTLLQWFGIAFILGGVWMTASQMFTVNN
ncbi:MAG: cation transporter [Leptospira sp.]|nr:cation transporter [Leptospira sp.]